MRPTTTQETHPWKATIRTAFQMLVGLAAIVPILVEDVAASTPYVAAIVAVAAAITRIMAHPAVESFLEDHLPWLSAAPRVNGEG